MEKRLLQFIQAENISQAQFADTIGVARASVSHILAGRNKPGFDFIESMSRHFPSLNIEWLITGKGRMYKDKTASEATAAPIYTTPEPVEAGLFDRMIDEEPASTTIESKTSVKQAKLADNKRNISKIIIFYDDNTFQELK